MKLRLVENYQGKIIGEAKSAEAKENRKIL